MDKEIDIVRAWKDEEYRNSLTPEQLAQLPPHPAGEVEMSDEELNDFRVAQLPLFLPIAQKQLLQSPFPAKTPGVDRGNIKPPRTYWQSLG